MVWSCKTSPKLQLFLWKVVQGAVALGENLARRGLLSNTTCRYCGDFESTEHIFLHCSVTRQVWDSSLWSTDFKPSDCTTFSEALLASKQMINLPPLGVASNLFPWIIWGIWVAKNAWVFENRVTTPQDIILRATRSVREWNLAQSNISPPRSHLPQNLASAGDSTGLVCFTDAAWHATSSRAGCGWIFMNQHGEQLAQGTATFSHTSSPQMAEALAIRCALLSALEADHTRICIKSDCQALVAALILKNYPADIYGITRDIEHLSLSFEFIAFSYVSRNLNFRADSLAKSALYSSSTSHG